MNKVIVITTDNELRTEDYPSGDWRARHTALTGMIGKGCRPNMLVDEDGYGHEQEVNIVGSWLYQTDIHGCPILGDIIIAGETDVGDGLDFIGLTDDQFKHLLPQLTELCEKARACHEIFAHS